jgi:predicted GIY-YIG superfamily endonuclease
MGDVCQVCGYEWERSGEESPVRCANPECRSPYWDKKAVVYVLRKAEGVYKIGCTRSLKRRWPNKSKREAVVCTIAVPTGMLMVEAERTVHHLMRERRLSYPKEDFALTESDIETLKRLRIAP